MKLKGRPEEAGETMEQKDKKPRKQPTPDAVRLRLADICARSEQCSADIIAKLKRSGLAAQECKEIFTKLKQGGFVDDTRYARAFASDKLRFSGWGPLKIRAALYAKHIEPATVSRALDDLDYEETLDVARKAASIKARQLNPCVREDIQKLYRFLATRGFTADICNKVAGELRSQ